MPGTDATTGESALVPSEQPVGPAPPSPSSQPAKKHRHHHH
jgi:hypothetical protein